MSESFEQKAVRLAAEAGGGNGAAEREDKPPSPQAGVSIRDVLARWRAEGPVVHAATGLDALDQLTRGGPVHGERWIVLGAPGAGKTTLAVQLAHVYAARGLAVSVMCIDQPPDALLARLAQRIGIGRDACEARADGTIDFAERELGGLSICFHAPPDTIERAASSLAARAAAMNARGALIIDGLSVPGVALCEAEAQAAREPTMTDRLSERQGALGVVARTHRLVALATAEMGRPGYAGDPAKRPSGLALAKWSGAIEYGADVLLALQSIKGQSALLEATLEKNRHGEDGVKIHLGIDRARQTLTVGKAPETPADRDEREARVAAKTISDAGALAPHIASRPGLTARELRDLARAHLGWGHARTDAAVARLGDALSRVAGKRGARFHHLAGTALDDAILAAVPAASRASVLASRPPQEPLNE